MLKAAEPRKRRAASAAPHKGSSLEVARSRQRALREQTTLLKESVSDVVGRYSVLFELAPIGYALLTPDGLIDSINARLAGMLHAVRAHFRRTPFLALIVDADRRRFVEHLLRCRLMPHGQSFSTDVRLLGMHANKDGSAIVHAQLITSRVYQGSKPLLLTAVVDMVERNEALEALRESEAMLRTTAADLELGRYEAVRASKQLRTLAWGMGQAEQRERERIARLLHDELQQLLVSAQIQLGMMGKGELVEGAAVSARRRISEAIALSRSLTQQLSPPVLQEAGLLPALLWIVRWMNEKHGVHVHLETSPGLWVPDTHERYFVFESVRELLLNTVKHAQVQEVYVRVAVAGDQIQVSVSDQGKGFRPEQLADGNPATQFGLASLRERVPLMGGSITIESAPGKGTRIAIKLPLIEPSASASGENRAGKTGVAAESAAIPGRAGDNGKLRILVVDDHRLVREGLNSLLKEEDDMSVVGEAANGREAVMKARSLAPDVVVMDVTLPVLDGIEATRIIASEQPAAVVIGMSMHERGDMAEAMLKAGARRYLTKGGPTQDLLDAIRDTARASRPPRQPDAAPPPPDKAPRIRKKRRSSSPPPKPRT